MNQSSSQDRPKKVEWSSTLWLNLPRAFCAGIIWSIVGIISGLSLSSALLLPFGLLIAYIPLILTYAIIEKMPFLVGGGFLAQFVLAAYQASVSLIVAVGDPFVYGIHYLKPSLLPVKTFSIINFKMCIFIFS